MKSKGFTFMEIVMVLIIVGILATLGITQYQKAVEKSKKAEAFTMLQSLWASEKRYRLDNPIYADRLNYLDIDVPTTGYYDYAITSAVANDFLAKATRKNSTNYLTINAAGEIQDSEAGAPGMQPGGK